MGRACTRLDGAVLDPSLDVDSVLAQELSENGALLWDAAQVSQDVLLDRS